MVLHENGQINASMSPLEWAMLFGLSVLWGGSFFFVGVLVEYLPPLSIVALRVALAAVVLNLFLVLRNQPLSAQGRHWRAFLVMGLLNNVVPFSLIVWGQTQIASGLAAILNATTPLFTVLVAHAFTNDERLNTRKFVGIVAGVMGVSVMIGGDALQGLGADVWAQCAILGAALSYGFAGVFGRRFRRLGVKPLHTAAGQVSASALLLGPVVMWLDRPWTLSMPPWQAWGALIALAVLSTALAYILYFRILATAGATNVLLNTLLVPVSAIILGAAFLNEHLEAASYVGMVMIALGLVVIDGRVLRAINRP